MAYELERIVGMLEDLEDGEGRRNMAALIDCPRCGRPLSIQADRVRKRLRVRCPADEAHFAWQGAYSQLPGWFDRYPELNP